MMTPKGPWIMIGNGSTFAMMVPGGLLFTRSSHNIAFVPCQPDEAASFLRDPYSRLPDDLKAAGGQI